MASRRPRRGCGCLLAPLLLILFGAAILWRHVDREVAGALPIEGAARAAMTWDPGFRPAPVQGAFNGHGFLAPGANATMHGDGGQSDTHLTAGPFGPGWEVRTRRSGNGMPRQCSTFVHRSDGKVVAMCGGLSGFRMVLLDPESLTALATFDLPIRPSAFEAVVRRDRSIMMNDSSGGAYLFLDNQDRVVFANSRWVVQRLAARQRGNVWTFEIDGEWDLKPHVPHDCLNWDTWFPSGECDKVTTVISDAAGRLWWTTRNGRLGTLDPATGKVAIVPLGEEIQNALAVDDHAVYVLTDHAQYAFEARADGKPLQLWRTAYDRGSARKVGSINQGSGTTPTLLGRDWITFTDNADGRINVVVLRRADGGAVCKVPVFAEGASATDNSMIAWGRSIVLENNAGYTNAHQHRDWAAVRGGVVRIDLRGDGQGCNTVWESPLVSPSVVPKLAALSGIAWFHSFTMAGASQDWVLVGLDITNGREVARVPTGRGKAFDNNWSSISIAPDGTLYLGTTQGLVQVRRKPADSGQRKQLPPFAVSTDPVQKLASSLARNATAAAISAGSARRPSGIAASIDAIHSGGMLCITGVLVGPGATALTLIRRGASSRESWRTRPMIAAFEAQ